MKYSWTQLHNADSRGEEYGLELETSINDKVTISKLKCEYCGEDIIVVYDKHKNHWIPYLGNQAQIVKNYKYSRIIRAIKQFYLKDNWDKIPFTQELENNIANLHARIHSINWRYRAHNKSLKLLCNNCFKKTYNRWQVEVYSPTNDYLRTDSISVIPEYGETIESIMEEFGITNYKIIGRGAKFK